MDKVNETLQLLKQPTKFSPSSTFEPECAICSDTRFEIVEGKGARRCECVKTRLLQTRLAKIPPKFAHARLSELKPDSAKHLDQAAIFEQVRQKPYGSFYLGGKFGTGKTMLMWAIYREVAEAGAERMIACSLNDLVNEYYAFFAASQAGTEVKTPRLCAEELAQSHTRYSIFLDDIDKAKPSEFVSAKLFEIVNAIYQFEHQLVITTNKSPAGLIEHFSRADETYGGAIVRRILDRCEKPLVEMF